MTEIKFICERCGEPVAAGKLLSKCVSCLKLGVDLAICRDCIRIPSNHAFTCDYWRSIPPREAQR